MNAERDVTAKGACSNVKALKIPIIIVLGDHANCKSPLDLTSFSVNNALFDSFSSIAWSNIDFKIMLIMGFSIHFFSDSIVFFFLNFSDIVIL